MVKKVIVSGLVLFGLLGCESNVEQTICFSQEKIQHQDYSDKYYHEATLGDDITLNGGSCQGKTLLQMNQEGWRLIQVVTGLNKSFGMILEK